MKLLRYFAITIFLTLALGEFFSRLLIPPSSLEVPRYKLTDHPFIRYEWAPNFRTVYDIEGIGGQKGAMDFEINPFGFRSKSMKTAAKPAGTVRLFFLGGSTTECLYLSEEKTFVSLVEKKLSERYPSLRFEAVNAGMSGNIAAATLGLLIYKILYYEPDIVFVMLSINDMRYGAAPGFDPVNRPKNRRKPSLDEAPAPVGRLLTEILKKSYFLKLIKRRILNRFFAPKIKNPRQQYDLLRKQRKVFPIQEPKESQSLPDFLRYMRLMDAVAKAQGVRLIFVTEASVYQRPLPAEIDQMLWMGYEPGQFNLSNDFLMRETKRFNDGVRDLSRQLGTELIDMDAEMPKDLAHFYDDVHFSPEGSAEAANIILKHLQEFPPSLKENR